MSNLRFITIGVAVLFFSLGLVTLPHYGTNWDATSHLMRGQAYLYYYLTGETDYSNHKELNEFRKKDELVRTSTSEDEIPRHRLYWQETDTIFFKPDISKGEIPRVSIYQLDKDLSYIMKYYDYGHPHISDVLSSLFNYVLFQKLGLFNDVDSYRIYGVLLAASLVGLIFWWISQSYGKFAGLVAAVALSSYPLFWAESHFNTEKDIPQAVYYSFLLFSVWRGFVSKNWKWILISGVFFGLALGSKFNVLFSIFIIVPWLSVYLFSNYKKGFSLSIFIKKYKNILMALVAAPLMGFALYLLTWPYFWVNTVGKIIQVISFYKTIGTASIADSRFVTIFEINTYAPQWILYTTPIVVLFLASIGVLVALSRVGKEKEKLSLLVLLWLLIPIARVSAPGTSIYGGVRQIMEFIPAMAILAGIGAGFVARQLYHYKAYAGKLSQIAILLLFIPLVFKLIEIHPNENTYFNPLIGGLAGAKERDFPSWGVSFGAPYREAIEWVNENAEPGAKLTLGFEILSNIPGVFIRPDIDYKSNRSGYLRQGEYVISLRFDGAGQRSYFDMYIDRMLEPVYQITVDSVPILKIWKNDEQYLKPEWKNEASIADIRLEKKENGLIFDVEKVVKLSRLELAYDESTCPEIEYAYLEVSKDGEVWERIPGVLPEEASVRVLGKQPSNGKFIEPFAGQEARYVHLIVSPPDTCLTQVKSSMLYYFR